MSPEVRTAMTDGPASAYEALIQFLYRAPIGLIQVSPAGDIAMINPMAAQLLMPLVGGGDLSNLFDVLEPVAPQLRALAGRQAHDDETICDGLRLTLPADAAVFVAAVADWRPASEADVKIKKRAGEGPPALALVENPDILRTVGTGARRPRLVVGFAAETNDLLANATRKLEAKGADLIVANDVSGGGVMGGARNAVKLVSRAGVEEWSDLPKEEVADRLAGEIGRRLLELESAS